MTKKQPTNTTNEVEKVYLPFYMLLDHLDGAPDEAFVACYIHNKSKQLVSGKEITICKLSLFTPDSGKFVNLPESFTIPEAHLLNWGHKIANWFLISAKKHCDVLVDISAGASTAELTNRLVSALSKDGETVPTMSVPDVHLMIQKILSDTSRYIVIKA
jgi:hypothetical protein